MTMRTITKLQCECGKIGTIVESENDQPFSKEWTRTSLRNLNSNGTYSGTNKLFASMHPSCKSCECTLTPDNIIEQ